VECILNNLVVAVKKNIPITGLGGPEGSGGLRIPDSVISALKGGRLLALLTERRFFVTRRYFKMGLSFYAKSGTGFTIHTSCFLGPWA
jgi:hypothetical protein